MLSKNKPVNKKELTEKKDRLGVLLALSSQEPVDKGPCPSVEVLAAFIDGTLEPQKRETILAHLNACSTCYHDWLAVSSTKPQSLRIYLLSKLGAAAAALQSFVRKQRMHLVPGFVMAAAVCLVFFLWLPGLRSPAVPDLIDESYKCTVIQEISLKPDVSSQFPWERVDLSYGFASPTRYSHASRAFGAGLWAGRQALLEEDDLLSMPDFLYPRWQADNDTAKNNWSETPWAIYFWMGRWCFLVQAVCSSGEDIPYEFWERQAIILDRIQKDYATMPEQAKENSGIVSAKLERLKSILENIDKNSLGERHRQAGATEIDFLIEHLSPQHIPQSEKEKTQ